MTLFLAAPALDALGLLIGYVMTARPWWALFRLREAADVAVVLACGTRYHRRMLAVVLKARAEAAAPPCPLPALVPEKTLVTGYITDRDCNRRAGTAHSWADFERKWEQAAEVHRQRAARATGTAPARGHAGVSGALLSGFMTRDEARARPYDDILGD